MAGSPTRTAPGPGGQAIADSVRLRADEWLPVGAVAKLLHIRIEDVLLLLVAGILPSRKRNEAPLVCRDSLENFAFSLALGLDEGESFASGLMRFLGWIGRIIEDPELPRGRISARDARLLQAVLGPEEAFARQFTHLLVDELAADLSREFESPERVTDRRTVTRRLQREARRDQDHRSRPSAVVPIIDPDALDAMARLAEPGIGTKAPDSDASITTTTTSSRAGDRSPSDAARLRTSFGQRRADKAGNRTTEFKTGKAPSPPTGRLSKSSEERLLTPLDMPSEEFEAWAEKPSVGWRGSPSEATDLPTSMPSGDFRMASEIRPESEKLGMPQEFQELLDESELDDEELDRYASDLDAEPEPEITFDEPVTLPPALQELVDLGVTQLEVRGSTKGRREDYAPYADGPIVDESVIQLDAKAEAVEPAVIKDKELDRQTPDASANEDFADDPFGEDEDDELILYDSSESKVISLRDISSVEGGRRSIAPAEPLHEEAARARDESGIVARETFELMDDEESAMELFDTGEELDDFDEPEGPTDGFIAALSGLRRRSEPAPPPPPAPDSDPFGGDPFGGASFSNSSGDDPFAAPSGGGGSGPPGGAVFGGFSASRSAPPSDPRLTGSGYAMPPPMSSSVSSPMSAMGPPPMAPPPPMPTPMRSMAPPLDSARAAPVTRGAPSLSSVAASLGANVLDRIKEAREEPQEAADVKPAPVAKMKKRASRRAKAGRAADRAPAPAKPKPVAAQATPQRRQVEIETVERRTTVRYYKQMYVQKNYPLLVIISQHKIKKLVSVLVNQVSSRKAFKIKKSNPIVHIRPIFPGCLCVPAALDLDVTERIAEAQFHLTPSATGPLDGARVEILYEGKVVDTIDVETVATTQAMAKLSGSLAFVTTTLGPAFKDLGEELKQRGAEWIGELLQLGGTDSGPIVTSTLLGLATFGLYWWNRPQEAPPIENFFDYEAGQETPGDAHVIAQKARIVVLSRGNRQKYELVESETRLGRSSECQIVLSERSVKAKHCRLTFNGDTERFSVEGLDGTLKIDGIEVDGGRELPREAVVELSQQCQLWFYNEREDEAGYDRPDARRRIEARLIETLGSFTGEIQAAFQNPQNQTVRAALAELMIKGVLTPSRWALIKRSAGNFA